MGLFDLFKAKTENAEERSVVGILVTLAIADVQVLFIMLGQDGSMNRLGTGSEENTERDMFIGKSSPDAFQAVRPLSPPIIKQWIGAYGDPAPVGKPCKLCVGFQTADGKELMSQWEYGSQSQGPPPEVAQFVIAAVNATNPWYESQKQLAAKIR